VSRFGGTYRDRPRRTARDTDVDRLERERGWLGTQLGRDPQDADPPDGHSDFPGLLKTAETSCPGCGSGEHEECECWKRGAA
jgi:hypothetical protein